MLENAHFIFIWISLLFYLMRGGLVFANKPSKTITTLSAISSMALFGSGIAMVFLISNISFANGWVMTKLVGILLYVSLGVIALKPGLSKPTAIFLWLLGLAVFAYTFAVAKLFLEPII